MRFLLLGNSQNDPSQGYPYGVEFHQLRDRLSEQMNEPVEARFAHAYPTEKLHAHVERILNEFDPHVVILHCTGLLVAAITLQHWFTRFDFPLGRAGTGLLLRWLGVDILRPNPRPRGLAQRGYAALYDLALRVGMGRTVIPVDDAVERYAAVIRSIAMREEAVLLVRGSAPVIINGRIPRLARRSGSLLEQFERGIQDACQRQRVPFISLIEAMQHDPVLGRRFDHGVHVSAERQVQLAEAQIIRLRPLLAG